MKPRFSLYRDGVSACLLIKPPNQALKSSASARWKTLLGLNCRNRLLLTGTPIQNSMAEVSLRARKCYSGMSNSFIKSFGRFSILLCLLSSIHIKSLLSGFQKVYIYIDPLSVRLTHCNRHRTARRKFDRIE